MTEDTLKKLQAGRLNVRLVADDLEELARSLDHIGMLHLAEKLDIAAGGLRVAEKKIDEGTSEALAAFVSGTEQATRNMVSAAIAGARQ